MSDDCCPFCGGVHWREGYTCVAVDHDRVMAKAKAMLDDPSASTAAKQLAIAAGDLADRWRVDHLELMDAHRLMAEMSASVATWRDTAYALSRKLGTLDVHVSVRDMYASKRRRPVGGVDE
jgi:hypothetical protein